MSRVEQDDELRRRIMREANWAAVAEAWNLPPEGSVAMAPEEKPGPPEAGKSREG